MSGLDYGDRLTPESHEKEMNLVYPAIEAESINPQSMAFKTLKISLFLDEFYSRPASTEAYKMELRYITGPITSASVVESMSPVPSPFEQEATASSEHTAVLPSEDWTTSDRGTPSPALSQRSPLSHSADGVPCSTTFRGEAALNAAAPAPSVKSRRPLACVHCYQAHVKCDETLPCARCRRLGNIDTCVSRKRNKSKRLAPHSSASTKVRFLK